ncbi:hypothetical protein J2W17_004632 [Pseudomonas lini]|uniref:hypothetical protein n=1 Tax=Pseudomonas lini TaxID=163011 RepID=UPI002784702B|nr:hypothetical protein [Pseudomonas lini]MDQ0125666.1 hypothetical protein [Pseudomonas lini]
MLKTFIKYTLWFVGSCLLLGMLGFYWFDIEAERAWKVINWFGGMEVVGNRRVIPAGMDDIYLRSLNLKPRKEIVYDLRALEPCREYSYKCMLQDSSGINLYLISTGIVLADVDGFLEKYKADTEFFEGACPVVYETTAIVKELASLRLLTGEKKQIIAKEKMKKIYIDGGLTYSLQTPACREFFRKKPYMAQAYIGHLAILMRFADGFSVSWMYLAGLPSVLSTIR